MKESFKQIIGYVDANISDILKEKAFESRNNTHKLILEELGSFDGQVKIVEDTVRILLGKVDKQEWVIDGEAKIIETQIPLEQPVNCILYWIDNKYGDSVCHGVKKGNTIELHIVCDKKHLINCSYTLAHEIMHYFQTGLKDNKGVNQVSMHLYINIWNFINNATLDFSKTFFRGLYICYAIEANANVSSITNYLKAFFKLHSNVQITNDTVKIALERNTQYGEYKSIIKDMKFWPPTGEDLQYIERCLTEPCPDQNKQLTPIYNKNEFNTQKFVDVNQKNIIKVCGDTIKKMNKNAMLFLKENPGN